MDVVGQNSHPAEEGSPNLTQAFRDILSILQDTFPDGSSRHSKLSVAARILSIKANHNLSEECCNKIMQFMKEILPPGNRMPLDLHEIEEMLSKLGLSYKKIDCCLNGCMLYYKDDLNEVQCKFCGCPRFTLMKNHGECQQIVNKQLWYLPMVPRLQRLFYSSSTAKEMRWHYENRRETGVLSHPSDGDAWKVFDQTHPNFASDPRNVRLGLCVNEIKPYGQLGRDYSSWSVIVTPYNLPPWMCMKEEYMFLSLIIPGPNNPESKIDVYLQPLIDELKVLWEEGISAYDISLKQNFQMRAALLWTINDFSAYDMLSGWMTAGKLSCPICMENSKAFTLKNGQKISFFDCHRQFLSMSHPCRRNKTSFIKNRVELSPPPPRLDGDEVWERVCNLPKVTKYGQLQTVEGCGVVHNWTKQSIFWELPYWKTNLIRHNLDVMHIEENVFGNVFYTVMDTKGRTKDNVNARMDIKEYCQRTELELINQGGKLLKPKAQYTLNADKRRAVCEWVKNLKLLDFPNLARHVNLEESEFHGLKSHGCHVFMECLLPIAFQELPEVVRNPLVELSQFFKNICSSTLKVDQLDLLEQNIAITLCKLEKIFPPGFFDSMEHLLIHLPYEAKVGGPVQYRWVYPFERFLDTLKSKVKNKACVEESIREAYISKEATLFDSHYFKTPVHSRRTRVSGDDGGGESLYQPTLSIFNYPGRLSGKSKTRFLSDREKTAITKYVLLNCDEVQPFLDLYVEAIASSTPQISDPKIKQMIDAEFLTWFRHYVRNPNNGVCDPFLQNVARGPKKTVHTWPIYLVNGYEFHTKSWSQRKFTKNSGICIKRADYGQSECDYYGILQEIVQVEYTGAPVKHIVLFKCEWFDPTLNHGKRIHDQSGIVEIRPSKKYEKYDPFIFAQQAAQVYYAPYPASCDENDWMIVIRTKARNTIDDRSIEANHRAYQGDEIEEIKPMSIDNDELPSLRDFDGALEEIDINDELKDGHELSVESDVEEDEDEDGSLDDDDDEDSSD